MRWPKSLSGKQHEQASQQIEANHALDGTLGKQARINAALAKQVELHAEDARFRREQDSALQSGGRRDGGSQEQELADQVARGQAAAATIEFQRQVTEKTIALRNEATNAGLQGEALYRQQMIEAEDDIRRSATGNAAQIASVQAKYDAERVARTHALSDESRKIEADAERAGLEGVARIAADLKAKLADIEAARAKAGGGASLSHEQNDAYDLQRNAANVTGLADREKLDAEYTDYVRGQVDSRTEAELSGFAKIDAAASKQHNEAQKNFAKRYINVDADGNSTDRSSEGNRSQLTQQNAAIDQDAAAARVKLTDDINQQTMQMDREAAQAERRVRAEGLNGWVQDYRSSTAAIEASENEMFAKIAEAQRKQGGDPAQYEQRRVDAARIANAQIVELNQQMRNQLANTLQQAFDDPVKYIEQRMKQMFFQIIADWLLQTSSFKTLFGQSVGSAGPASTGAGGGLTGSIAHSLGLGHAVTASTAQASSATASGAGSRPFGGTGNTALDSSGTIPGYSAGDPGLSGSGSASSSSSALSVIPDASSLAQTGLSTAAALSQLNPSPSGSDATSDPWNDPTKMSSSDPSSPGYNGQTGAGAADDATAGLGILAAGAGAYTGGKSVFDAFESGKATGILNGGVRWRGAWRLSGYARGAAGCGDRRGHRRGRRRGSRSGRLGQWRGRTPGRGEVFQANDAPANGGHRKDLHERKRRRRDQRDRLR